MPRPTSSLILLACAGLPAAVAAQPPASGAPAGGSPAGGPAPFGAPTAPRAGRITGAVVHGGTGQPVANASVTLRAVGDSAIAGGGFTRADGTFRLDGLRPGRYTVRVRQLGFSPVVRADVRVADAAVDLGRLALAPVATQLSAVAVTAERSEVSVAPDRTSYAVKDLPAASGGTAVDVLRNVPSVEVDGDNALSLRGNSGVVVQINGRISPMRGEQLGNFLAQLPAHMVARVEVVANPSAKNDPEGMAGIINIVLKENTDLGLSGGLAFGGGTTGQANASGNVGYQRGPLTLAANYGFLRDDRAISGFTTRQGLADGLTPYLASDVTGAFTPRSHSLNATADYKLGARTTLSSNLVASRRDLARSNDNLYRVLDAQQALTSSYLSTSAQDGRGSMLDYALSARRTAARPGDGLTAEVRVNRSADRDDVRLGNRPVLGGGLAADTARETNATDAVARTLFLQTDYTRTLAPRTKLEAGYKGTFRDLDNRFDVATAAGAGAALVPDAGRSNAFAYGDQVHALYGVLSQGVGRFDLQSGLRVEQADARFDLATVGGTPGERYNNSYLSFYPSAVAAYNVDPARQVKLSYSKRVTRPDTRQLNPFGFREDALNVFRGNPRLQPEYTHAVELGLQQTFARGSVQLTPFARRTENAVRFIRTVDDAGVSTTTFQNVATSDSYGADVIGSLRLGRLTGFGGLSAYRQVTDGSNLSTDVSNQAFGWSARGNATVKLTGSLDAQGFLIYRAPQNAEQGRVSAFTMSSLSLRQKLRGEAASVTLRIMDPLNQAGFGFVTDDGRFYQTAERKFGMRGVFLSFNYNFGRAPRVQMRQPVQADAPQPGPGGPG